MPSDDVLQHSQSDIDYYEVLGGDVHPGSTENEISRAYRKKALATHPDKRPDDSNAATAFHQLQIAFDVLSDSAAKAAYDNARAAREMRKKQVQMMDGKRKRMAEDLERRESGAFKRRKEEVDAEELLEREIRRLAEDGRKRRMQLREEEIKRSVPVEEPEVEPESTSTQPIGGTNVDAMQRTCMVRWIKNDNSEHIDKQMLATMFARFGHVDSTLVLKDKKTRLGDGRKKKQMVGSAAIVFSSIVSAHKAVEDKKDRDFDKFYSIEWADGKGPDISAFSSSSKSPTPNMTQHELPITPAHPSTKPRSAFPGLDSNLSTPVSSFKEKAGIANGTQGTGLRKVPSFSSFNMSNTPGNSPWGKGPQTPSKEEITMIRLRNAEKKRVEEKIRQEEMESVAQGETEAA
jgi:DnaJ family protein C protein 17